jgi:hypothetical protein
MTSGIGAMGCFSTSGVGAMSCEALTAFGTWALTLVTIALVVVSWLIIGRQVKETTRIANEQISASREESKARLLLQYQDKYDSPGMVGHRGRLAAQLFDVSKRTSYRDVLETVPLFYESMGLLLREGHLDLNMVWNLFGNPAPLYWRALKGFVAEQRQEDSAYWSEFEYLVDECYKIEMARSRKSRAELEPSDVEVKMFLRAEALQARAEGTIPIT